jgi:hypothetical protein
MCSKSSKPNPKTLLFWAILKKNSKKYLAIFSFTFERKFAQKHLVAFRIICV